MNDSTSELELIRTQLRAAIERDLRDRSPRSRIMHRRSFRMAIPTVAVLAVATAAIVLALTVSAASPSSASAAAQRALAATAAAPSGTMTTTCSTEALPKQLTPPAGTAARSHSRPGSAQASSNCC